MDLIKKIENYKNIFFPKLYFELEKYKNLFLKYKKEKKEILDILKKFIIKGKGIRGGLVYLTNEFFKTEINQKNVFYLASFFEVIHSSLLIHDDIMDNDKLRRGEKTIHFYFDEKFKKIKNSNDDSLGKDFAINIGDIGIFIGFDLLNKINIEKKQKNELFSFIAKEYIKVALGQTDDVFFSKTLNEPKIKNIFKIYLYKTARYTFVLPIITTLFLKKNQYFKNKNLILILENIGLIFQITDDLIGFLSDKTGKDLGSDIRENKKTIIRYFLIKELKNNQLKNFFGKKNISKNEIDKLRNYFHQSKTKEQIFNIINKLKTEIYFYIKKENYPQEFKKFIINFLEYLINRNQ